MYHRYGDVAKQRIITASCVCLCLCFITPARAWAGLVFHFDNDIDAASISAVLPEEDRLSFVIDGQRHVQELPGGTRDLLIAWASSEHGGPIVLSIDGALVSADGDTYAPRGFPPSLRDLLLQYDVYAHQVACGSTLEEPGIHPLERASGSDAQLPHRQHQTLLDPENHSSEATWYRRLAARHASPPGCIGELTLRVQRGRGGAFVRVEVDSWIHQLTNQWYRTIDVPTEWDRWAARLPYRYLTRDLEKNWNKYRATFAPLDELTSMVETMAMLRAVRKQAPQAWTRLVQDARRTPNSSELPSRWFEPELSAPRFAVQPWRDLSRAWVGAEVDTPAEANLALSLMFQGGDELPAEIWFDGIKTVAQHDPRTRAKLDLALLISSETPPGSDQIEGLFSLLRRAPQGFRLRARAIGLLADTFGESPEIGVALERETKQLLDDFVVLTRQHCVSPSDDVNAWEDLSQNVYSVALLNLARSEDGRIPPRIVEAVACIHRNRALALQVGRSFAYRHAHMRLLGYLARQTDDFTLKATIHRYRQEIARTIGVPEEEISP